MGFLPILSFSESYAKGFVDALNALHRTGVTGIQTVNGMAYNVVNSNNGNMAFPLNQVNGQNRKYILHEGNQSGWEDGRSIQT